MQLQVVTITLLWTFVQSVDRGTFKTCEQSSFCKRQRATQPGDGEYEALLNTLDIQSTHLGVQLVNSKNIRFLLEVIGLENNMIRVRVKEANPVRERYESPIGDVLIQEPEQKSIKVQKGADDFIATVGNNKIVLTAKPFRLDIFTDDEPVVSLNARGLMNIEHIRPPKQQAEEPPAEEGQEVEQPDKVEDEDEEGMWAETFKTHQDTKPHGPSSVGIDIAFPGFQFVYGIPEHADTLALKSTKSTDPYRLYNLDVFEYETYNPMALYGSVPVMLAHNEKRTIGIFWLNAAETWVDITSNVADKGTFSKLVDLVKGDEEVPQTDTHWISESGLIDVFIMLGPKANDVFKQYATLTGTTPLPPLFSLAYHQSRWNYNDEQDVANVNEGFDKIDMPMDVIWLDIEHSNGRRYFTWDESRFPKSAEMLKNISTRGRKMVNTIDPHIKRDNNWKLYSDAKASELFVKDRKGNEFEGWCWPGSSSWLDFLDPKARRFWAEKFLLDDYKGSTLDLFTWNDMNEPSVFNGPEITMHKDALHYEDWEHRDVHNVYGMYVHRATYEGHLLRSDNKERPFVLSRAFYAGSQRYGAVWTGDNTGEWEHLKISIPMVLSLNLVGITLSGADVGGFFKNPDVELLTRWYQAGAYQPFFRAHAHIDTKRREPWLFPENYQKAIRSALRARYSLLPYWYTLFRNAELHGGPVMKPLWVEFPKEKETFAIEDEHMVGSALLVHPVVEQGATGVTVHFPGEDAIWYDIETYKIFLGAQKQYIPVDLYKIPVYQRGGTIIPRKERIRRASSLSPNDPYTLVIALDKHGKAHGDLYADDNYSFEYDDGDYLHRNFDFDVNKLTSSNADPNGTFQTKSWLERVVVLGAQSKPSKITITIGGETKSLEYKFEENTKKLTIRKPGINIADDFTINIE